MQTDGRTDGHEDNKRSSQFSECAKNVFSNISIPHILCARHYLGTHFCEDHLFVNIKRSLNTGKTERNSVLYQQRETVTTCSYVQSTWTVELTATALYSELPAKFHYKQNIRTYASTHSTEISINHHTKLF